MSDMELSLLLSRHLNLEQKTFNFTCRPLDSGGQHFSSNVHIVTVSTKSQDKEKSHLDLIVKVLPGIEKQIQVNSKLGFQKEASFYQLAIPEYHKVQMDHNLEAQNIFPKYFSASEDIIVLEDLSRLGYIGLNKCLDEKHTLLVLQELAKFHATGVAVKLSDPDIFRTKLATVVAPALQNANNVNREEINIKFRLEIRTLLESMYGFESLADEVDLLLKTIDDIRLPNPSEPYATLLHNDLWRGNILFTYSQSKLPSSVKFVDFQTTIYNSPARDLVYFLFTSVEKEVLNQFESVLLFYHGVFAESLFKLGCETLQFTFEKLMFEINCYGPTKLKHMICLLKNLSSYNENNPTEFKQHFQNLLLKFQDRGWLQRM